MKPGPAIQKPTHVTRPGTARYTRRLASLAYEAVLQIGIIGVLVLFPQAVLAMLLEQTLPPAALWLHLFGIELMYFSWFWSHGGQTLAMKTWKIRLLAQDGNPLNFKQAVYRQLLCWLSLGCGGIGLLWGLFDRDGQFLHDRLLGYRLVAV